MEEITIRFHTLWQLYLGIDRISLQADNMEEAMAEIEDRFGTQLREQLQAHGIQADLQMRDYSLILLNGYNVNKQDMQQFKLKAGDIVHIFPLAMGGQERGVDVWYT